MLVCVVLLCFGELFLCCFLWYIHYLRVVSAGEGLEQVLFFVCSPPPQATVQGVQEEWEDHSPFMGGGVETGFAF